MTILAITGGIGSGKSTVAEIFRVLGIPVFDADSAAKQLYQSNKDLRIAVASLFGRSIFDQAGTLDTKQLAAIVFRDTGKLMALNALVHPIVIKEFFNWTEKHKNFPVLVHETALLYESGLDQASDFVALVRAPESLRIERVCRSKGWTPEQVKARMRQQSSQELLEAKADFIIENDEQHPLLPQVVALIQKIQAS